jgi:hypothetical protein
MTHHYEPVQENKSPVLRSFLKDLLGEDATGEAVEKIRIVNDSARARLADPRLPSNDKLNRSLSSFMSTSDDEDNSWGVDDSFRWDSSGQTSTLSPPTAKTKADQQPQKTLLSPRQPIRQGSSTTLEGNSDHEKPQGTMKNQHKRLLSDLSESESQSLFSLLDTAARRDM